MKKIVIATALVIASMGVVACSSSTTTETTETTTVAQAKETTVADQAETKADTEVAEALNLQIGQAYFAAHGTRGVAQITAVVSGDTVIATYIDEYQFLSTADGITPVPNSDKAFGTRYVEGFALASKRINTEYYSGVMASAGSSTVAIDQNYDAIQEYAEGKTIAELEETGASENALDAVSGATLADTAGYINGIVEAAKAAQNTTGVEYSGDISALSLNFVIGVAHSEDSFGSAAVLTDGETIVLAYVDELIFLPADANPVGVPNTDSDFATSYSEEVVLSSKRENNEYYSGLMKQYAQATSTILEGYEAIQTGVEGLSSAEVSALDAVSGATLGSSANYLALIAEAAK